MTLARFFRTNMLYCGDNLERLRQLPDESVDLVYLDPPFFSNRTYEVIWGDEAEVRSFKDRWEGGINRYIEWMEERVVEMHRVLKPTGSFYLHCDTAASHYLKVMADGIFGMGNFLNEFVWKRTSAHNDSGRAGRIHDNILFYSKGAEYTWNKVYQKYDPEYVQRYYRYKDENGRRFMSDNLTGAGSGPPRDFGERGVLEPPTGRHWMYDQEGIDRLLRQNRIFWTRNGVPRLKTYLDEAPGMPLQDVWNDVQALRSWHRQELLGYPTQKPLALLERIIQASSNPDDVVLDPFCGCGTSVAAAHMLKREWIGVDISPTAVNVMKHRLQKLGVVVDPIGLPQSVEDLKALQPFEFQNWVIQQFYGTHEKRKSRDMGIDGYSFMVRHPIQVKRSERVGRPVVDSFETAVERASKDKGYIVAFSFTRDAHEEAARVKRAKNLEIKLVKVAHLLEDVSAVVTPLPGQVVMEEPVPESPGKEALPPAEVLVESARTPTRVA